MARKKIWRKVDWTKDGGIKKRVVALVKNLDLHWIKTSRIYCFRSSNSTSRAYARIWGLSKVWQLSLDCGPAYAIEVLSQHFDKLPAREQDKVLLHELAHIPKNFSGSLLPHIRTRGKRNFHSRVEELISQYSRNIIIEKFKKLKF